MEAKKALLVVNPVAGGIDKAVFIDETLLFAQAESFQLEVYETTGLNDVITIEKIFSEFHPERIIVAGGDGTIKLVAEALQNEKITLGILPAGTSNGLAADLDLPMSLEECIEIAFGNDFIEIDQIIINGKLSLHLSDIGLNAQMIRNYHLSESHGKWSYLYHLMVTLIESEEPFGARIIANGKEQECECRMIVIANAQMYGTRIVINPEGKMDDGRFELIIIKNLDLLVFAKILTGNIPMDSEDVEIISTNSAVIRTDAPVSFQIDGEYEGDITQLNISVSPQKVRVAVP